MKRYKNNGRRCNTCGCYFEPPKGIESEKCIDCIIDSNSAHMTAAVKNNKEPWRVYKNSTPPRADKTE